MQRKKQEHFPLENQIITNEKRGKKFMASRKVECSSGPSKLEKEVKSEKGKDHRVHYMQTTVVNPCTCQQHKMPQQHDKIRGNQRKISNKMAQKQGVDLNKIN